MQPAVKVACHRKPRATIPAATAGGTPRPALPTAGRRVGVAPGTNLPKLAPMGTPPPPFLRPVVPGGALRSAPGPVPTLVRRLILEAGRQLPPPRPGEGKLSLAEGGRSILLDLEVDGVRCLLVRQPRPAVVPPGGLAVRVNVCLSPREREITRLITQGYPNKAIADVLDISAWTVCTHLRRIFVKFGVSSRAAMVARFLRTETSAGIAV